MFKKATLALLILGVLFFGCWHFWPIAKQGEPDHVLQHLHVGMLEEDAHVVMKAIALDSGTQYYGGTGNRRVYFELPQNRQIWVYCERASTGIWNVVEIGQVEAKQHWVRHEGDSIFVK